jgi:hypothetical protein
MLYENPCISHVALEPPTRFAPWCRQLAQRKHAVDAWLSESKWDVEIDDFVGSFPDEWLQTWKTVDAWSFIRVVLPFFDVAERENTVGGREEGLLWVEPSLVVGESGRWRFDSLDERQRLEALECCERQVARYLEAGYWSSHVGGTRILDPHPRSMHISPLGLYLAHEGKNRVALYQRLGLPMPTVVWANAYITPDRMTLVRRGGGWFVQLDRRETRELRYCADIIAPLMAAYGVATVNEMGAQIDAQPARNGGTLQRILGRLSRAKVI